MLGDYLPILILVGLALAFGVLSMLVSSAFAPEWPTPIKLSAYECGIEPERLPQGERFSVKFHLIAMLFIIFDVEAIFLFLGRSPCASSACSGSGSWCCSSRSCSSSTPTSG